MADIIDFKEAKRKREIQAAIVEQDSTNYGLFSPLLLGYLDTLTNRKVKVTKLENSSDA